MILRRTTVILALLALILVLCPSTTLAQSDRHELPLRGVIEGADIGLNVRQAPPLATPFSYKLAKKVCAIGTGSEFIATERTYVANGEVWYRIKPTKIVKRPFMTCSPTDVGWMVAKTKNEWMVTVLEDNLSADVVETTLQKATTIEYEYLGRLGILLDYLLLLLGTAAAICTVSIIRARTITPSRWASRFLVFEFGMLAVVNLLTAGLLIDQLLVVDEPNVFFELFKIFQGAPGGFLLLGFLLSVLLLRFVSFAAERPATSG